MTDVRTPGQIGQVTMPIKYEVLDITPETALGILDGNTHNRNIRQQVVDKYAVDMRDGTWEGENGQSIVVSNDGRVVDGQHRLWAIVQSETTQRMLLVSNVAMSAQVNVDTGAKRAFGDVLKLQGEIHVHTLAAVCRRAAIWEAGGRKNTTRYAPSHAQLLDMLQRHPELRDSAVVATSVRRSLTVHTSVVGLCHWLFNTLDLEDCEHFFSLVRGEHDGLGRNHPVRVLHKTVADNKSSKSRLTETITTAYMIKAWNAYRDGRELGLLRYRPGGANPESFPEPF